jgi:hypothetical protein
MTATATSNCKLQADHEPGLDRARVCLALSLSVLLGPLVVAKVLRSRSGGCQLNCSRVRQRRASVDVVLLRRADGPPDVGPCHAKCQGQQVAWVLLAVVIGLHSLHMSSVTKEARCARANLEGRIQGCVAHHVLRDHFSNCRGCELAIDASMVGRNRKIWVVH